MARALTAMNFTAYAQSQVAAADQVLATHRVGALAGLCGCGRVAPCAAAVAWAQHRAYFQARLTAAESPTDVDNGSSEAVRTERSYRVDRQ